LTVQQLAVEDYGLDAACVGGFSQRIGSEQYQVGQLSALDRAQAVRHLEILSRPDSGSLERL
jgi:hypothetical protein